MRPAAEAEDAGHPSRLSRVEVTTENRVRSAYGSPPAARRSNCGSPGDSDTSPSHTLRGMPKGSRSSLRECRIFKFHPEIEPTELRLI